MTLVAPQPLEFPQPHRFTREEYYTMAEAGILKGRRVELVDGEVIDMSPMRDSHVAATLLAQRALQRALPEYLVRTQMPLCLAVDSEPEPDISVVPGSPRDYVGTGHPKSALLVVEVSDTTLRFDRVNKAALYAAAGILEYWIINLIDRCVEVFREPGILAGGEKDPGYRSIQSFRPPTVLRPTAKPESQIPVADLLP